MEKRRAWPHPERVTQHKGHTFWSSFLSVRLITDRTERSTLNGTCEGDSSGIYLACLA